MSSVSHGFGRDAEERDYEGVIETVSGGAGLRFIFLIADAEALSKTVIQKCTCAKDAAG